MDLKKCSLYTLILLLFLSSAFGRVVTRSPTDTLQAEISVTEEQALASVGENLNLITRQALERAGMQWENLRPTGFTLLEDNTHFRICPSSTLNTSFLCLKSRLDRERLCPIEKISSSAVEGPSASSKPFDPASFLSQQATSNECTMTLIVMVDFLNTFEETQQQRILSITVRVLDINDHTPSWSIQNYDGGFRHHGAADGRPFVGGIPVLNLRVREHMKPGSKMELPQAVDPDAYPENTTVAYGIASESGEGVFSLEWTGKAKQSTAYSTRASAQEKLWLVVNEELDRDEQKSHRVKIFAVDGGAHQPKTGYLMLNITVEDVNNHPPQFEKRSDLIWVLEHSPIGVVIYRLRATDKDDSDFDKLAFSMSSSAPASIRNLFSVDSRTGEIRLQGELDYEKETSYKVPVSVSDGLWFDESSITVAILNINDHPPEITLHSHLAISPNFPSFLDTHHRMSGSQLTIEVIENGPSDQLIATFTVGDLDDAAEERFLHTNSPLRESFLQANGITLEQANERMQQSARCKVNYDFMEVGLISKDSRSSKARFQVRLANKALDRESAIKHLVRIECWDQANRFGKQFLAQNNMAGYRSSLARSASVVFTLIVLDENDSTPQFVVPSTRSIAEGQPAGTTIMQVVAKDADDPYSLNGQLGLRYKIVNSPDVIFVTKATNGSSQLADRDPATWFTLEPRTGELRSAVMFDREVIASVNLTIEVTDGGDFNLSSSRVVKHNSASITIQVNLSDVNDCQPIFDKLVYQLNITEGATPPLLVGSVHADDCDVEDNNRRLHYWLQQPSKASSAGRWFTVSRTGELYLGAKGGSERLQGIRPLDREREEVIMFEVFARDHGQPPLTGSAQIIIRLEDVNDNSPVWQFPKPLDRFLNVSLEAAVGQRIAQLSATDSDEGPRGRVTYHIVSGNDEGHFELDEQSGCLYIVKSFITPPPSSPASIGGPNATSFYESRLRILALKTFRLYLQASDQGDPPRQTTGVLDIRLAGPPKLANSMHTPFSPTSPSSANRGQSSLPTHSQPSKNLASPVEHRQPPPPQGKHRDVQEGGDGFVSSESLVVIAVMVAAVAALLFIVVLLAVACLRKRMLLNTGGNQRGAAWGRGGMPRDAGKPKTEFELLSEGKHDGGKYYMTGSSSQQPPSPSQQNVAGSLSTQFLDSTSTYVTVTRNSLRGNNDQREIISIPTDLATTFGMRSLDNLSNFHPDMLAPYRLDKDTGSCGLLLHQVPSPPTLLNSTEEINSEKKTSANPTTSTTYTLAGKTPVLCSTPGVHFGTRTPQTMQRNATGPGAAYVALSPAAVAYTAVDSGSHGNTQERLLLEEKGAVSLEQKPNTGCGGDCNGPLFIALARHPSGFVGFGTEAAGMTYTSLNFAPPAGQQQVASAVIVDGSGSPNQESSFV